MAGWGKGKKGPGDDPGQWPGPPWDAGWAIDFFDPSWAGMKGCGKPCFGGPMFPPGPDVGFDPFLGCKGDPAFFGGCKGDPAFFGGKGDIAFFGCKGDPAFFGCKGDPAFMGGCKGDPAFMGGCKGDPAFMGGCRGDPAFPGGCKGDPAMAGGCKGDPAATAGGCKGDPAATAGGCKGGFCGSKGGPGRSTTSAARGQAFKMLREWISELQEEIEGHNKKQQTLVDARCGESWLRTTLPWKSSRLLSKLT